MNAVPPPSARNEPVQPRFWPVWQRGRGRHGQLARYVSTEALVGLRLVSDVALDQTDCRMVAEGLYATLCAQDIGYAHEPWIARPARQQVRHPRWLLEDRWGTCLDLAVTYATMLLAAGLRPLLAVSRRHAFVVVSTQRRDNRDAIILPGCSPAPDEQHEGVLLVDTPSELVGVAFGHTRAREMREDRGVAR